MKSSIAVRPQTLELLKHAREERGAQSYDDLLQQLVLQTKKPKKSMFGAFNELKKTKEFEREELERHFS